MVTKQSLMRKWEFTGVDVMEMTKEIVDDFRKYGHRASYYGVMVMLDEFITNKADLIRKMMPCKAYNGNLQIVLKVPFDRDIDPAGIRDLLRHSFNYDEKIILKSLNAEGKTLLQLLCDIVKDMPTQAVTANQLTEIKKLDLSTIGNEFCSDGYTSSSHDDLSKFKDMVYKFSCINDETLNESYVNYFNGINPNLRFGNGMKTSRAFNKLCTLYGIDKDRVYAKVFTKYSDLINPITKELVFVISVNPKDYLRMSFGANWSSCHTIDPDNVRGIGLTASGTSSYHGAYRGGTLSYMLDEVSMISYVVKENEKHPENEPKIYRNMFHYNDGWLMQGRAYPQSKDGNGDLYKKLRLIVQKQIAEMLGIEYIDSGNGNDTWVRKGDSYSLRGEGIYSTYPGSVHYPDYSQISDAYRGCNLSYIRNFNHDDSTMVIGHHGIDIYSGDEYSCSGSLYRNGHNLPARIENQDFILEEE